MPVLLINIAEMVKMSSMVEHTFPDTPKKSMQATDVCLLSVSLGVEKFIGSTVSKALTHTPIRGYSPRKQQKS